MGERPAFIKFHLERNFVILMDGIKIMWDPTNWDIYPVDEFRLEFLIGLDIQRHWTAFFSYVL